MIDDWSQCANLYLVETLLQRSKIKFTQLLR